MDTEINELIKEMVMSPENKKIIDEKVKKALESLKQSTINVKISELVMTAIESMLDDDEFFYAIRRKIEPTIKKIIKERITVE
jgi:hypothetical protein